MDTERTARASVIEVGQGQGRLSLGGVDLHAGDIIEVKISGIGWTPARVERDERMGWVAYVRDGYERSGDGQAQASVLILLREGLQARRA